MFYPLVLSSWLTLKHGLKRVLRVAFILIFSSLSLSISQAATSNPGCSNGVGNAADLQAAVNTFNTNGQDDVITLVSGCIYTLTSTLTIQADGDHTLTITGGTDTGISGNNERRVIKLDPGSTLTMNQIIVRDGKTDDKGAGIWVDQATLTMDHGSVLNNHIPENISSSGGGIYNDRGTVTLIKTDIADNSAAEGGGISNTGVMLLDSSTVAGNIAEESGGGGIVNSGHGMMTLSNFSLVADNSGFQAGGIFNRAIMTVINTTVTRNLSTMNGGGITNGGDLTLDHSIVSENKSSGEGGGITNYNKLTVKNGSSIISNTGSSRGGGIFTDGGTIEVTQATISLNVAEYGGGIYNKNPGTTMVTNSTFMDNIGDANGGAIYNEGGTITLTNNTFTGNVVNNDGFGGALYNAHGVVNIGNSILANSIAGSECFTADGGAILPTGINLVEDESCNIAFAISGDPLLDQVTGEPGYFPLLPGSPAIDTGSAETCPAVDQRNTNRPQDGDNNGIYICDLGAYEADGRIPPPTATPTLTNTPDGSTLTPTVGAPGTATPTSTVTVEPDVTELLVNGDFEAQDTADKPLLTPWTLKKSSGDGIKCNKPDKPVAHLGTCAFRFKGGTDEASKLAQVIALDAMDFAVGDTFTLNGWFSASSATVSGSIKLIVSYADVSLPGEKVKINLHPTSGYETFTGEVTLLSSDLSKIKLQVKHTSLAGKVYFDAIGLVHAGETSGLLPLP